MFAPHIFGLNPVASSMSLATVRQSARRPSSSIAFRNFETLSSVCLVFASAMFFLTELLIVPIVFLILRIDVEFEFLQKIPRRLVKLRSLIIVPMIVIRNFCKLDIEACCLQRVAGLSDYL